MERVDTGETKRTRKAPAGRQDKDGPAVIKRDVFLKGVPELVKLKKAADDAADEYKEASVKLAEKCGLNTAAVNKRVSAEVNDKIEEETRKVEQLAIAFEVDDK
jgi:hypothetical protein